MQKKIEKKLFNLFTGELTATILFAVLYLMYIYKIEHTAIYLTPAPAIFAFALLEWILLQGSFYWFLKWRQFRKKDFNHLPKRTLQLFRWFKRINLVLILVGVVLAIYLLISSKVYVYWYFIVFIFAAIEHVNYYHVRLSYMSSDEIKQFIRQKGFRRSKLAKELDEIV